MFDDIFVDMIRQCRNNSEYFGKKPITNRFLILKPINRNQKRWKPWSDIVKTTLTVEKKLVIVANHDQKYNFHHTKLGENIHFSYSNLPPRRNCVYKFLKKLRCLFETSLKNSATGLSFFRDQFYLIILVVIVTLLKLVLKKVRQIFLV